MLYGSSHLAWAEAAQILPSMRKLCSVRGLHLINTQAAYGELRGELRGIHGCAWQSSIRGLCTPAVSKNCTGAHQVSRCDTAGAADLLELAASPGWPMLLPLAEYDVRMYDADSTRLGDAEAARGVVAETA